MRSSGRKALRRPAIHVCALACGLVVIAAPPRLGAQPSPTQAEVLADWSRLKTSILQLIDFMPPEKFSYKLPFSQRVKLAPGDSAGEPFGRRVLDIAQTNLRFLTTLGGRTKPPVIADSDATTKAAAMKAVADSFDYGIAILQEQTEQTMWQKVNALSLGPSSRVRVFNYLYGYSREVDGQLVLYLRLSGEVLPASSG